MKKTYVLSTLILLASLYAGDVRTLVYPPFKHTWGIHKGTEGKLDMLLGNATDFVNPQGLALTRLIVWDDPDKTKDDDELTAYGINSGRDEIIYNISMYSLDIFGETGSGPGQFKSPRGISADPKGDVFVCDTGNRRVAHLFNSGKGLKWVKSFGEELLVEPHDVSVTEAGTLFVTDRARGTIEVFTYDGEHVKTLGGLVYPTGIAVDNPKMTKSRYAYSFIYVIDGDGTILRKMDYDGKILSTLQLEEMPVESGRMKYIALDFFDNAWVTDSVVCKIYKFDKDLRYITSIGECGDNDYQFEHPTGIAIWRRFGQIVVGERRSAQYFWIGTDIARFDAAMGEDRDGNPAVNLTMYFTDRTYAHIEIKRDGQLVRELYNHKRLRQGSVSLTWDLKDDAGTRVPPGEYTIEMTIEPTYSSFGHFDKDVSTKVVVDG